jgi:hypothetical protein
MRISVAPCLKRTGTQTWCGGTLWTHQALLLTFLVLVLTLVGHVWVEKTWIVLMDSEERESSNANFSYGVKLENQSFWRDTRLRNIHMAGIIGL